MHKLPSFINILIYFLILDNYVVYGQSKFLIEILTIAQRIKKKKNMNHISSLRFDHNLKSNVFNF